MEKKLNWILPLLLFAVFLAIDLFFIYFHRPVVDSIHFLEISIPILIAGLAITATFHLIKNKTISFIITLAIAIGLFLLSQNILALLYGSQGSVLSTPFSFLSWSLILIFLNLKFVENVVVTPKLAALLFIGFSLINGILSFIIIPLLSLTGTILTTIATQITLSIALFVISKRTKN